MYFAKHYNSIDIKIYDSRTLKIADNFYIICSENMEADWNQDIMLINRLKELVRNSYKQKEILVFIKQEFQEYNWR